MSEERFKMIFFAVYYFEIDMIVFLFVFFCLELMNKSSLFFCLEHPPPFFDSLSTITISSSKPTQFRRSSHWTSRFSCIMHSDVSSLPAVLVVGRTSMLRPFVRPSSSHTRISSPRQLTLTAFPRAVISASLIPEVWPQSRMPGDIDSEDE